MERRRRGVERSFGGPTLAQPFIKQLTNAELELVPGAGHAMWIDVPGHAATITCKFFGQ